MPGLNSIFVNTTPPLPSGSGAAEAGSTGAAKNGPVGSGAVGAGSAVVTDAKFGGAGFKIGSDSSPILVELPLSRLSNAARFALGEVDQILVYAIALRNRFRGITVREGLLLHGPAGWGEAAPFWGYDAKESARWLLAGLEGAISGYPQPKRLRVGVNVTIPVVDPQRAYDLVINSGKCASAKVKVAEPGVDLEADCRRLRAVRAALNDSVGAGAKIRVDANSAWSVEQAIPAIEALELASSGLEYVEQPCASVSELAQVRKHVQVAIAADESIRRCSNPFEVARQQAADLVVIKAAPLGGVRRALQLVQYLGLGAVVSSAVDSGVGLRAGIALAGALPKLDYDCGLATARLLNGDICKTALLPKDGALLVSDIQVDLELLRKEADFRELVAPWQERLEAMAAQLLQAGPSGAGLFDWHIPGSCIGAMPGGGDLFAPTQVGATRVQAAAGTELGPDMACGLSNKKSPEIKRIR